MKFATLDDGTLNGRLLVVSRDLTRCLDASHVAPNLITLLQRWDALAQRMADLYDALNMGTYSKSLTFEPERCAAPLPRAPQWCDASAFLNHGRLMEEAYKTPPIPDVETIPLMYQGASDDLLGPHVDVALPSEEQGIDFEGEFGVIVGDVPMGIEPGRALECVRLLVQINDWSLRGFGPREMKTGFGFLQAKPSTSFAPVAVTPDELGDAWCEGRVQLKLHVEWNGERFGEPDGGEMNFGFGELIAHAACTRKLSAGTIIGSGTVSNANRSAGSACVAERRVIELIDHGAIRTSFLRFGDRVRMHARWRDGGAGPFGVIDQQVVAALRPAEAPGR